MAIFGKETVRERYKRWWEGKYCRCSSDHKFRYVQTVEFIGPPSGFFGVVILHYLDGIKEYVPKPIEAFRPRKTDVMVEEGLK